MNVEAPEHRHERLKKWALIAGIVVFIAATGWNVATRIGVQRSNATSIEQVVDTIEEACQNRHAVTVQYQVRARNQITLTRVALLQTYSAIAFFAGKPGTEQAVEEFRETIPQLQHILETTKILPLEDCRKQAAELRAHLPAG